jgi:hypothetical protein
LAILAAIRVANAAAAMIAYFMIYLSVLRRLNVARILEQPCEEQFASAQIAAAFPVGQRGWSRQSKDTCLLTKTTSVATAYVPTACSLTNVDL